jgi:hypothetical protein
MSTFNSGTGDDENAVNSGTDNQDNSINSGTDLEPFSDAGGEQATAAAAGVAAKRLPGKASRG